MVVRIVAADVVHEMTDATEAPHRKKQNEV